MCVFCIFVDKGIQSLRDDCAVVGKKITQSVHLAFAILHTETPCPQRNYDKNVLTLWSLLV